MNNPIPRPATPAEVAAFIASIGGLCEWKPLCPPSRWHEDTSEDAPLVIPDDEEDDYGCPFYDEDKRAGDWYADHAREGRIEAYFSGGGR